MNFRVTTVASGSGGNCYLIEDEENRILVDMGISNKRVEAFLKTKGLHTKDMSGLFLTHGHTDHIKGLKTFHKKAVNVPVFLTEGTLREVKEKYGEILIQAPQIIERGYKVEIDRFIVKSFSLSHDSLEPIGYTIFVGREEKQCLSIVTDTGFITEEIFESIKDSDIFIIEANHEVNLLLYGGYPYNLKQRILGSLGHLSNEQTCDCIKRILEWKSSQEGAKNKTGSIPRFILSHLSRENNTPDQAYITVKNSLEEAGYYVGKHMELYVAPPEEPLEVEI